MRVKILASEDGKCTVGGEYDGIRNTNGQVQVVNNDGMFWYLTAGGYEIISESHNAPPPCKPYEIFGGKPKRITVEFFEEKSGVEK